MWCSMIPDKAMMEYSTFAWACQGGGIATGSAAGEEHLEVPSGAVHLRLAEGVWFFEACRLRRSSHVTGIGYQGEEPVYLTEGRQRKLSPNNGW